MNLETYIIFCKPLSLLGDFASCSFETKCAWVNSQGQDTIDWVIKSGKTWSSGTGPDNDNTLKNSAGNH